MENPVIVYAKRTAIGKFMGGLSSLSAPELSKFLIKDALVTTKIAGEAVNEIILGQVLTAGTGQAPARQAALYGGLPHSVCATTLNRVCGSGLKAVMLAASAIKSQEAEVVFCGGQENMSLAPHLLLNSRAGYRFGNIECKDHAQLDGLWDPYNQVPMGECGELCAREFKFSREEQDAYALESYTRARAAQSSGHFKKEIIPIEVSQKKQSVLIDQDEEPSSVDLSKIGSLRPAFAKDGTITAANASSINDGAALLIVMSATKAKQFGLKPLARILSQDSYAHDPRMFTTAPIFSIQRLLKKAGLTKDQIDCWEINEAFSVVPMAAIKELSLDAKKVNPHGGAVSLGHPIGASGARIVVSLLNSLSSQGGQYGIASICIGGGEASSLLVESYAG